MSISKTNQVQSETIVFFSKIIKLWAIAGLHDIWIFDIYDKKIHINLHRIITLSIAIFIVLEYAALFTQNNLTDKQFSDLILFTFSHPIVSSYYIGFEYHKAKVKDLLIKLHITLKNTYNDPIVEKRMIKKASFFSLAYLCCLSVSLASYGFDSLMQVIRSGATFTTVVTAWPDVEDRGALADLVRIFNYIIWWVFVFRISAVSTYTIMTSVAISHQFRNLQCYFHGLNDIFQTNVDVNKHKENEFRYIEGLKVGIKLHSDTLWCIDQCQVTCNLVYSGQIVINVFVLCLLMLQMVDSERTLINAITIFFTTVAILAGTGLFMLNAGDITVEAAGITNAIYASGWQNCRGSSSAGARRLLVVAMMQGQKHVSLHSFGIVEISYESFLAIVKSSYSIFSLLY